MYPNCKIAVDKKNTHGNCSSSKEKVNCEHAPTACVIVGNSDVLYACIENAPKSPQRVYSQGMRHKDLKEVKT